VATGFLGRLDDLVSDDMAMWLRDKGFLHFARHALLDQVTQSDTDFGDLLRIDR
jgi:hypothetical protein